MSIWDNDKIIPVSFRKRAMLAREIAKNLLPSLHNKTHFQGAIAMYNNQPGKYNIELTENNYFSTELE